MILQLLHCVLVCVSVWEGSWGWGWGEAGGSMPLPTRPQRYCDPTSLVLGTCVGGGGHGVWIGVGCPCPPIRNDIVTPRHLFLLSIMNYKYLFSCFLMFALNKKPFTSAKRVTKNQRESTKMSLKNQR